MNGLQELARLDLEFRRAQHPTLPDYALPPSKFSDKTANELTRCIVRYLFLKGHFSTRLQSVGSYRDDIKKFVASQQRKGLPDVLGCINGQLLAVEVKIGNDKLSEDQKRTINDLRASGAIVLIARDFQRFIDWFEAYEFKLKHPIPRLATPDLSKLSSRNYPVNKSAEG